MPTYSAFSNGTKIRNLNIEFAVLLGGCIERNVAPVVAVLEMNARDGLVRACASSFERRSKRRDCQNATASRLNFAIRPRGTGVENFNVLKLCRIGET